MNLTRIMNKNVLVVVNQMPDFNERLLKEIAYLRFLQGIEGIKLTRIMHCLEMLRYVRNSELGITFDEGLIQEDEWIKNNNS
ncbi:hypothetical protein MKZ20_17660 [Psychrobacillus sp. FSL K6-2684]|uniref:hypothetical protein n=1 Tax=Psychrobacillus sp. FSL K6-2684 TaxID=2921547 RepID=UPI0030F81413